MDNPESVAAQGRRLYFGALAAGMVLSVLFLLYMNPHASGKQHIAMIGASGVAGLVGWALYMLIMRPALIGIESKAGVFSASDLPPASGEAEAGKAQPDSE